MSDPFDPNRFLDKPPTTAVRFSSQGMPRKKSKAKAPRPAQSDSDSEEERPIPKKSSASGSSSRQADASSSGWGWSVLCFGVLVLALVGYLFHLEDMASRPLANPQTIRLDKFFPRSFMPKPRGAVPNIPPHISSYIDKMVASALKDPVGRRDFALAADGARIAPKLTSTFELESNISVVRPPTNILDEDLRSGSCWEFPDNHAQVGIKLKEFIIPTHITIDHVPHELAADIRQAPRRIVVWGAVDGRGSEERVVETRARLRTSPLYIFGDGPEITAGGRFLPIATFEYSINTGSHIQTFPADPVITTSRIPFVAIVVEVMSNWGAPSTRVYRVRIHGESVLT
ncbi:hypothetical protein C8Q76DRAFT_789381 [Earliella scabrosa]|nr:hypothetical protein C8Q76DRAFT_789381 [Earliella scabrosa]